MSSFESTLTDMWNKGMQAYATAAQKGLIKETVDATGLSEQQIKVD